MINAFTLLAILFAIVVGGSVVYLLTVLAAATVSRVFGHSSTNAPPSQGALPRLAVVVPAHDEADVIELTLASLARQNYDRELYEIVVVADNCTDATAEIARLFPLSPDNPGMTMTVFERVDRERQGKGHALNWAIGRLLDRSAGPRIDAIVIVDADTRASMDFLGAIAERLASSRDAHGYCALQGRYGVLNAGDGMRAALMSGAFELFNHVRPLGRDRLGLTVGLKGNGMAFSRELLCVAEWSGSLTEDIDFALDLCRHHGVRVAYVPEARVDAVMPATANAAASQRSRWENGRYRLMRERALPMLAEGLRTRNLMMVDAAIDLMIPPLVELSTLMLIWAVLAACGAVTGYLPHAMAWIGAVAASSIGLFVYILGGLAVAGASASAYTALIFAPFYAVWKLCLYASRGHRRGARAGQWIRTARAPMPGAKAGRAEFSESTVTHEAPSRASEERIGAGSEAE